MDNREYLANGTAAPPTRPVAPSGPYPQGGLTPTKPGAYWFHQVGEELRAINLAGGVAPDGAVLNQLQRAIKRLAGANVTTVNFAASPFALTVDHAGLVLIDATAGNVVLNLPLANLVAGLPLPYEFERIDATANTVSINAAGANLIDGAASFTLLGQWASRSIRGDAVSIWATLATSVPVATTAEVQAQSNNSKIITPLGLSQALKGANQLLGVNGYQRVPGGLIIQWGVGTSGLPLLFPIAFPSGAAPFPAYGTATSSATAYTALSDTGMTASNPGGNSYRYIVVGY